MTYKYIIAVIFLAFVLPQESSSQDVADWSFEIVEIDDEKLLKATASIKEGWFIYSQHVGEDGPIPTSFDFQKGEDLVTIELEEASEAIKNFSELFGMEVIKYKNEAVFTFAIDESMSESKLSGEVTYMACDKSRCLPPVSIPFEVKLQYSYYLKKRVFKAINPITKMRLTSVVSILLFVTIGYGQILEPVKWTFDTNQVGPDEYDLFFKADIEENWKVYSQFTSDDGPVPTTITYESDNVEKLGDGEEFGDKKQGLDKMFGVEVIAFTAKKQFLIKHRIKLLDASKPVKGYVTFMTCNDETCLPPTDVDFKFTYNIIKTPVAKQREPDGSFIDRDIKSPVKTKKAAPKKVIINEIEEPTPSSSKPKDVPAEKKTKPTPDKAQSSVDNSLKLNTIDLGGSIDLQDEEPSNLLDPVKWNFDIQSEGGDTYALNFTSDIEDGWTVYSLYTDDNGPFPTSITYDDESVLTLNGDATETGHKKKGPDPLFLSLIHI